jgi:hypothetical protein
VDGDPNGFLNKDFTFNEVNEMVKTLGNGKAAGWDQVPNEALKEAPREFIDKLVVCFNRVKNQGVIPEAWKRGRLVLLHKKGPTVDINNYRPLTVLTVISGLYTKVLNGRLVAVVETHRLLGEIQNGFRKSRSGSDCTFILNTILWKSKAKNKKVHMAFLDLVKAYDSVDRPTLWRKLAAMGFGGAFLSSIQKLYQGDYVTCEMNGITTAPVYLGRGLRQGCSLSPLLFALYVSGLGHDLTMCDQGVLLHKVCVSAIFFADDLVLIAKTAEGLKELLEIVQRHCVDLSMKLSIPKSKVMSSMMDAWVVFEGEDVAGCLDKVVNFKYLGVETFLSPHRAAVAMRKRAVATAKRYKAACLRVAYDGPDVVDVAMATWLNIAIPSIVFGCECVPFTESAIDDIERYQTGVGKSVLGLPVSAPNVSVPALLGVKSFREVLYTAQLKFLVRLQSQDVHRWSHDAYLDHLYGGWVSPFISNIAGIKREIGMVRGPVSVHHVDIVTSYHFLKMLNDSISASNLPALRRLSKRVRSDHVNETSNSQVGDWRSGITVLTFYSNR